MTTDEIECRIARLAEEYRRACADVTSYGLALMEAPRYTPAREDYHRARLAQIDARARLEVQCEALALASDGVIAAAYLDAAIRCGDLASQLSLVEARERRSLKGVA